MTSRTTSFVNVAIVALALTVSACSNSSTSFGPSPVEMPPPPPPEWSQPNPLADPTSGDSTGMTVALLSFSPPRGSRITPTVGFPPLGGDPCAENRCFKFQVELCNRTEWSRTFGFFWSADGIQPLTGPQVVTSEITVPSGQCLVGGTNDLLLFFPPGVRQMIVVVTPSVTPGWNDSWPRFSFDLQYTN